MHAKPCLTVSLLLCALPVAAQTTPSTPAASATQAAPQAAPGGSQTTLSVNARLVTLPVVVRDKKDKIVSGLTKDDFILTEDGRPETIRYFNLDTNLPLTLALNVDTSGSMRDALDTERTASQSFLDGMITRPEDRAAVLHFDREVELLQDVTASKPKLNEALNQLGPTPAPSDSGSSGDNGNSGGRRHGGTQLYDSIYLSASDVLTKQTGRKAIIVLSDGEDRGSRESLQSSIEAAQKAEAEVYTIYFKGEGDSANNGYNPNQGGGRRGGGIGFPGGGYPGGGGGYPGGGRRGGQQPTGEPHVDGKKIMQQIADETGGRFFEAKKKENFDAIYKEIADELRQQYMLGYTPDAASEADGFHRVSLTTKKKDLYVQTRAGYYGRGTTASTNARSSGN